MRMGNTVVFARKKAPPWATTAVLGVLLVVLGVMLARLAPAWKREGAPVTAARELAKLQTLGRALRSHAEEHDGKFPGAISGIEWRQNLPGLERAGLPAEVSQFHDPETGRAHAWRYYPGRTLSDPPETILVAAPFPVGEHKDQRLVVRLNAVAEMVAEGEFQRQKGD